MRSRTQSLSSGEKAYVTMIASTKCMGCGWEQPQGLVQDHEKVTIAHIYKSPIQCKAFGVEWFAKSERGCSNFLRLCGTLQDGSGESGKVLKRGGERMFGMSCHKLFRMGLMSFVPPPDADATDRLNWVIVCPTSGQQAGVCFPQGRNHGQEVMLSTLPHRSSLLAHLTLCTKVWKERNDHKVLAWLNKSNIVAETARKRTLETEPRKFVNSDNPEGYKSSAASNPREWGKDSMSSIGFSPSPTNQAKGNSPFHGHNQPNTNTTNRMYTLAASPTNNTNNAINTSSPSNTNSSPITSPTNNSPKSAPIKVIPTNADSNIITLNNRAIAVLGAPSSHCGGRFFSCHSRVGLVQHNNSKKKCSFFWCG